MLVLSDRPVDAGLTFFEIFREIDMETLILIGLVQLLIFCCKE